jgi:hypothetical protein
MRLQIYLKVTVDTEDRDEQPEKLASELVRQAQKVYGVRSAEVSSVVQED